ncbi:MAG: hypothetical protein ACUVV4_06965 [Candidatus Bathyarchaeia archaeon]
MTKKEETIWDKLLNIPQWAVGIATFLFLIIPILYPLGLPVPVGAPAADYIKGIQEIPSGSNVLFFQEMSGSGWDEIKGGFTATLKYLWSKKINVIIIAVYADAGPPTLWGIDYANPDRFGAKYGENYVFLGYIPGEEVMVGAVRDSIINAVSADYLGTPIKNIPLLQKVDSYKDFHSIIVCYSSGTSMDKYVRQWYATHPEIPQLWMTASGNEMSTVSYWVGGMAKGYLSGPTGCAAMENFIGEPGLAAKITDMKNLASIPTLVLVAIGNIAYFGKKWFGRS